MFTGIIEAVGMVKNIRQEGRNIHFTIHSSISSKLKIDQSVSHNGVCLTVVGVDGNDHVVTAVKETLDKSSLGNMKAGDHINLERSVRSNSFMDGHIVQGHVDATGFCEAIKKADGSWYFTLSYPVELAHLLVDKGSVTVDGVSLTIAELSDKSFSVAIIPYTFKNTCFKKLRSGDEVNLEFDIIGKYFARYMNLYGKGK